MSGRAICGDMLDEGGKINLRIVDLCVRGSPKCAANFECMHVAAVNKLL
jgi:hypothetical protein